MDKTSYDLSHFMPKTFDSALEAGLVPFSLIDVMSRFMTTKEIKSIPLSELISAIKTESINEDSVILADYRSTAILKTLSVLDKFYGETDVVELTKLQETGLQVDVMLFKDSGKLSYSGVVSVGDMRPWLDSDLFKEALRNNQKLISGDMFDGYTVVVSDTALNENDLNYTMTAARCYK